MSGCGTSLASGQFAVHRLLGTYRDSAPTVFQWHADGSEIVGQTIADTGGHLPISGAEAIVRGMPGDFVVALLGAHDPPQLSYSYQRLVNYIRAAAIITRVDPVAARLLAISKPGHCRTAIARAGVWHSNVDLSGVRAA